MRSLTRAFMEGLAMGSGAVAGVFAMGFLASRLGVEPRPQPPERKPEPAPEATVHPLHVVDKDAADIRGLWEEQVAE